jgi:hypothetical protein
MTALTKPDITARIATLAQRLGFAGPDAVEQVLEMALDYLDDSTAEPKPLYTRERRDANEQDNAARMAKLGYLDDATGRPKGIPP